MRAIASNADAAHDAPMAGVIGDGVVLRAAVVPERYGVGFPTKAHLELGPLYVVEQDREDVVALGFVKLADTRRVVAVDVDAFASRDRMRSSDGPTSSPSSRSSRSVGMIASTSGWTNLATSRHGRQTPHASDKGRGLSGVRVRVSQTSACAKAQAIVVLPTPAGPWKSRACGTRPSASRAPRTAAGSS